MTDGMVLPEDTDDACASDEEETWSQKASSSGGMTPPSPGPRREHHHSGRVGVPTFPGRLRRGGRRGANHRGDGVQGKLWCQSSKKLGKDLQFLPSFRFGML